MVNYTTVREHSRVSFEFLINKYMNAKIKTDTDVIQYSLAELKRQKLINQTFLNLFDNGKSQKRGNK